MKLWNIKRRMKSLDKRSQTWRKRNWKGKWVEWRSLLRNEPMNELMKVLKVNNEWNDSMKKWKTNER